MYDTLNQTRNLTHWLGLHSSYVNMYNHIILIIIMLLLLLLSRFSRVQLYATP